MYESLEPTPGVHGALDEGIELIRRGIAIVQRQHRSTWNGPARAAVVVEISEACERLEAERVRAVGDWDADRSWADDGALSAPSWIAAHTPVAKTRANQIVRTARLARRCERVGEALAAGDLSSAHADVLATATRGRDLLFGRDEASLLDIAPKLAVDDFATAMQHWRAAADDEMARVDAHLAFAERSVSYATTIFGRVDLQMQFDADGGATVIEALQAYDSGPDPMPESGGPADGPRTLAQRHADAMVQICAEAVARRQAAGHPTPGIDGTIDVSLLSGGTANGLGTLAPTIAAGDHHVGAPNAAAPWDPARVCELHSVGPVAREVLTRLACDAAVGRIVMRGRSEVLDVGRRTRVVPRSLHRAIERRDRGCAFPGCAAPVRWCDVHHLVHWADGGPTNLENCLLLCRRHHVLCHEGGWLLGRRPDGAVEVVERGPDPRTRRRPRGRTRPPDGRPSSGPNGSRRSDRRRAPPHDRTG